MEELLAKTLEQTSDESLKVNPTTVPASMSDVKQTKLDSKASSSKAEDDLDVFLLGDLGSDDEVDPGMLFNSFNICFYSFGRGHLCLCA